MEVILITGGTSGLGLHAARNLLEEGHAVVITGRDLTKLESATSWILSGLEPDARSRLHTILLDFESLASVREAVEAFKALQLPLHVLVNNAGTITPEREFAPETTMVEKTIFVNAIAPFYLTWLLLPLLKQDNGDEDGDNHNDERRILFVTSSLHDPQQPGGGRTPESAMPDQIDFDNLDGHKSWDGMLFYKISKLAVLWITYLLSKQCNIPVIAFCPGFVPATGLSRNASWIKRMLMRYVLSQMSFARSEIESAADYVFYATNTDIKGITGECFQRRKVIESSPESRDMERAKQFWDLACNVCKLGDRSLK
ncbi:hypothetical protein DFQ28_000295 [Apophysomyces sp. BC1034]|nr:hypothetical protein DFQ30_000552 [Apophysomyces sp. BC1015]KAG0167996.1 hypothetical protein DFQ29_000167 [Apophysomyces sp. BC1021]KAG0184018.1 hypothetical protein DFQ28_000295 [Apophysomyces sp. BC1034]